MSKRKKKSDEPVYDNPTGRDPFAEGADARLAGQGDDRNPFKPATDANLSWNDGWNSIDEDER